MVATADTPDLAGIDPAVYKRRWAILGAMCLSLVLIVATVSSVNVAIPSLAQSSLAPSDTQILWIIDAYAVVFAALLLPAGAIGDKFGRKGALLTGLAVFAIASALCALVESPNALIALRAVMGIGAALIMPSTLSLLQVSFPPQERPKAIAAWSGFAGAGGAIGPLIGGFLLEHFWYGSVFLVAAPLAIIGFIASAVLAPRSKEDHATPLDPVGALLSIVGFAALLVGIIEGPERGWTDSLVLGSFVVAVVGLVGFVLWERRAAHPMLDMTFFRNRRFAMGSLGITFTFLAMFSMFFVLTQYLQYVRGYTPLQAGVRGLPFAVGMIVMSPRSPKLAERMGVRPVVAAGFGLLAAGLLLLSTAGGDTPYALIGLYLFMMAIGVGLAMPSLSIGILGSVPINKAGVGSAVNDTTREVGGAIGIAFVGTIVNAIYRDRVGDAVKLLPAEAADAAQDNLGKAIAVASDPRAPQDIAGQLLTAVRNAFLDGSHLALRITAAITVVAAIIVVTRLPRDKPGETTTVG